MGRSSRGALRDRTGAQIRRSHALEGRDLLVVATRRLRHLLFSLSDASQELFGGCFEALENMSAFVDLAMSDRRDVVQLEPCS